VLKIVKHLIEFSFNIYSIGNPLLMAADVPENVSIWTKERTLGSGGFGAVDLYRNEVCSNIVRHHYSIMHHV